MQHGQDHVDPVAIIGKRQQQMLHANMTALILLKINQLKLRLGTIDGAAVHPRIVVRRALELNAAAVIFTHNHTSGVTEPSSADVRMTKKLKEALGFIDVRVLDHIIAGTADATSMAESGLL